MVSDTLIKIAKGELITAIEAQELKEWADQLGDVPALLGQIFKGVGAVPRLSQITTDLGTINRGVFLSGDNGDPLDTSGNDPYTGVGMWSPGLVTPDNDEASIFGMNAGALQFWLSALTGRINAGAGVVQLGDDGVSITVTESETVDTNAVKFVGDGTIGADGTVYSAMYGYIATIADVVNNAYLYLTAKNAPDAQVFLDAVGTSTGQVVLRAVGDGADTATIDMTTDGSAGEIVLNQDGDNIDVRIESDGDANNFFSDAGNNRVGFGTNTPSEKVDVNGNVNVSGVYKVGGTEFLIDEDDMTTNSATRVPSQQSVKAYVDNELASLGAWAAVSETWTRRTQAYTNDPAAGSGITLNMTNTSGFTLWSKVNVSSSAGNEDAIITAVVDNTSITVNALALNHTTTNPLVTALHSFTLSGDFSADENYQIGNRVRYTDGGGNEYGVIIQNVAVSSVTYISLASNDDYSLGSTITNTYISKMNSPIGYPHYFSYTPGYTSASGSMTVTITTDEESKLRITGKTCDVTSLLTVTIGGTPSFGARWNPPTYLTEASNPPAVCQVRDAGSGVSVVGAGSILGTTFQLLQATKSDGSNWTAGTSRLIRFSGSYQIA